MTTTTDPVAEASPLSEQDLHGAIADMENWLEAIRIELKPSRGIGSWIYRDRLLQTADALKEAISGMQGMQGAKSRAHP